MCRGDAMDCVRLRGKVYQVVCPVPTDLVETLGKKQIWRSLKTKRYSVARSEARKVLWALEQSFQKIRGGMDNRLINGMVAEYGLDHMSNFDTWSPTRLIGELSYDEVNKVAASYTDLADGLRKDGVTGECYKNPSVFENVLHYIKMFCDTGIITKTDTTLDDVKALLQQFNTADRLLFKLAAERMQGTTEIESDFQYRLLEKWNKEKIVKKDLGIPLTELLTIYGAQWTNDNPHQMHRKQLECQRAGKQFSDFFEGELKVGEIDNDKVIDWRNWMHDEAGHSRKTVDNYIETLFAAFNTTKWTKEKYEGIDGENPFKGAKFVRYKKESEFSRVFSRVELQKYIDILTEFHNPDALEMTWLPVIMMFSGMRCNEVAQLYLDDIATVDDVAQFRITKNLERSQRVKTDATRMVPIHPVLKELGFMQYVKKMKVAGEERLFPNLKLQKSGHYYGNNLSTKLNTPINLMISSDKELRLYSLRKTFRSRYANIMAMDAVAHFKGAETFDTSRYYQFLTPAINDIMGHKLKGTTGDTTYTTIAHLVKSEVMKLITYPVNLDRLRERLI
jgi:integrase